jgi:succinate dehydrogenase / fumarate reductase, cytochrome b subunit
MNRSNSVINSSVGKKLIMGVTGVFLCLFLVAHLSGNFLLFKDDGGAAFNQYSHFMSTNGIVRIVEIVLLLGFLFHMVDALVLTVKNRSARPIRYAVNAPSENSDWASRNMGITGSMVLIFLVFHLNTFFVPHRIMDAHETMYQTVANSFQYGWRGWYWIFYVAAMALIGFHLNHGFRSAFQTLGLSNKKYGPLIERLALLFSIIIPAGFATLPVYFYVMKP